MPDAEGHPFREEMDLRTVANALGDPLRYQVIATLAQESVQCERHCTSFGLPVSKATRTYHFRILREAGLIWQVDRGNSRMAQLRRDDIDTCFPGLLRLIQRYPPRGEAGADIAEA